MIRIRDIKLPVKHDKDAILDVIARMLCLDRIYPGNSYPDFSYRIIRRSVDARKKPDIFFVYTVELLIADEDEDHILGYLRNNSKRSAIKKALDKIITEVPAEYTIPECGDEKLSKRPVVVGMGPAGMFAALILARRGFCPIVIERGESVDERTKTVEHFWKTGDLNEKSNVQFGEGGAGTFSDGKLNTLTKDTNGRNTFVLRTFYEHGAPESIIWDAKPHIGTDVLARVVKSIRQEIISLGGQVRFNTKLTGITTEGGKLRSITVESPDGPDCIDTDICIICPGHSARDTFSMLHDLGIRMEQKNFAVGFRVTHPQDLVNFWQYGVRDSRELGLGAADYKVACETSTGRRVYSFCMCPGGVVVNASSEQGMLCVNGMSGSARDGEYANSAIIAAVTGDDFCQDEVAPDHPLAGMYYQRNIEKAAFLRGGGAIPYQSFKDFEEDNAPCKVEPSVDMTKAVKGSVKSGSLRGIFSDDIDKAVIESMHKFGYTMKDFDNDAVMLGIEARTSSPVRILRDGLYESNIKGLYPCGEGAGYAGGITSAAADGIRCAESIIGRYRYTEV